MQIIIQQIELIQRVDQLIRLQATGNSNELALRLGVSKTKLYRILNTMRTLNAPILYDVSVQSFIYIEDVQFHFGFYNMEFTFKKSVKQY